MSEWNAGYEVERTACRRARRDCVTAHVSGEAHKKICAALKCTAMLVAPLQCLNLNANISVLTCTQGQCKHADVNQVNVYNLSLLTYVNYRETRSTAEADGSVMTLHIWS